MKKIVGLLFIFACAFVTHAATAVVAQPSGFTISKPANISVISLGVGSGLAATDTFAAAAGSCVAYGPFNLSNSPFRPRFIRMRGQYGAGCLSSTDSLELQYQIINGTAISDTGATWIIADTIRSVGNAGNNQDISTKSGQAIVFKARHLGTAAITRQVKKLRVALEATGSEEAYENK